MVAHPLPTLHPTIVTALTNLPSTWTATNGPWFEDVAAIFALLTAQLALIKLFVEFVPQPATTSIEVVITAPSNVPQEVVVGAIESCPVSETVRYQNGLAIQQSTVQTFTSYLDGGTPVPLLQPDTLYTITVAYNVLDTLPGSSATSSSNTQAYQFQTDSQPPSTLAPYVLCSSPGQGDQFVFYEDPLDIIFNDNSVFSLFEAYGYQLSMDLHAADGLPEGSPGSTMLTGSPSALQAIDGIGTATYDAMLQLAKGLPCVNPISVYQNQVFTAPVYLRPLIGYTFDLITIPSAPAATSGSPPSAVTPLFRRSFSTGRYANMQAFASALGGLSPAGSPANVPYITHRALSSPLGFPLTGGAQVFLDADIQQTFMTAGEQALPAPNANSIVLYWVANSHGIYVPHCILLDAIEPVWRYRSEPGFTTPIPSDPSFQIVTIGSVASLEVAEAGGSIGSFIVSPGGARTVAMFNAGFSPTAAGTLVTLELHRPASAIYGNPDETAVIIELLVQAEAPWENDHV